MSISEIKSMIEVRDETGMFDEQHYHCLVANEALKSFPAHHLPTGRDLYCRAMNQFHVRVPMDICTWAARLHALKIAFQQMRQKGRVNTTAKDKDLQGIQTLVKRTFFGWAPGIVPPWRFTNACPLNDDAALADFFYWLCGKDTALELGQIRRDTPCPYGLLWD